MNTKWMDGREISTASRNIKEIEKLLGHPIPSGMYFDVSTEWMSGSEISTAARNIEEVERNLGYNKYAPKFEVKGELPNIVTIIGAVAGAILVGISCLMALF